MAYDLTTSVAVAVAVTVGVAGHARRRRTAPTNRLHSLGWVIRSLDPSRLVLVVLVLLLRLRLRLLLLLLLRQSSSLPFTSLRLFCCFCSHRHIATDNSSCSDVREQQRRGMSCLPSSLLPDGRPTDTQLQQLCRAPVANHRKGLGLCLDIRARILFELCTRNILPNNVDADPVAWDAFLAYVVQACHMGPFGEPFDSKILTKFVKKVRHEAVHGSLSKALVVAVPGSSGSGDQNPPTFAWRQDIVASWTHVGAVVAWLRSQGKTNHWEAPVTTPMSSGRFVDLLSTPSSSTPVTPATPATPAALATPLTPVTPTPARRSVLPPPNSFFSTVLSFLTLIQSLTKIPGVLLLCPCQ